ncbi:type II toxin-antitoxin system RatA family toxin [Nocardia crassostreae]|uniref:type II toxin-antitoxin system RatA family toxin n=1 Tax=Nocardia crassostreae TaxID=53428 RepID=UPI00082EB4F7|nr:SRPBCC family protein [Nocardia crassostreae]
MRAEDFRYFAPAAEAADSFDRISDFARYPEVTDAVVSVDYAESGDRGLISAWVVKFRRGLLCWTERDVFDRAAGTIEFEQLTGDFTSFHGRWRITGTERGAEIGFTAEFDLGMPTLADILDPVAESALRDNITRILGGPLGELHPLTPADTAESKG